MIPATSLIGFPNPGQQPSANRKLLTRWGGHDELFGKGFLGVPAAFLTHYARLQPYALTTSEAMFVLHLMDHKWTEAPPFPAYKTLADRMNVTPKMVRRYAAKLEEKGYLVRNTRIGSTNTFDLTPLFNSLRLAVTASSVS
jgi:hypothetical protein